MDELISLLESIQSGLSNPENEFSADELDSIRSVLAQATEFITTRSNVFRPPQGSELLWVLSGGDPRVFSEYMRSFPSAAMREYAEIPGALQQLSNQFASRITMPTGEQEDGIPRAGLQSSNVYGFQYDPRNAVLRVRFNGGGIYEYQGVPAYIFKMFARGAIPAKTEGQNQYGAWWKGKMPSLGASMHELIKLGGFPYSRVA